MDISGERELFKKVQTFASSMRRFSSTGKVSDPESLLLYVGFDTPG